MHVDTKSQCPVYAYMYLLCEYAYMWIPEVSVQYLLPSMSTLPFETEFLLNLDLTDFARLIDLQTSWFIFFLLSNASPELELQMYVAMPSVYMWVVGMELESYT